MTNDALLYAMIGFTIINLLIVTEGVFIAFKLYTEFFKERVKGK
jgi:hypothetical protein